MTTPLVTRVNRALNPRASSAGAAGWTSTRGWSTGGAGTYSYVAATATPPPHGVASTRRKTWTTASSDSVNCGFQVNADGTNYFPVTAGELISVSAWMRHTSATVKNGVIRLQFFTAITGGTSLGTFTGTSVPMPGGATTTWYQVSHTVVVPDTAVGMLVFVDLASVGNPGFAVNDLLDANSLLIESGPLVNSYFDGAYPDTATTWFDWNDAANNSTSKQTDLVDPTHSPVVRNQLSYWDGATWPQIGPAGITGPVGPTGPDGQAARTSCGGCRFRGSQTAQPTGAIWDTDNFVVDTAVSTDPNPCLGIAASNELQVLRNTTAMILTATLRMTTGAPITARSCITFYLNGSLMLGRTSIRENEDTVTCTAIGHLALGDRIRVQVYLNTTSTPFGYNCYVTAALAP